MEEFLKRHNFDINSKMKTRKFNIVRYFPKVDTYEFLNVGVVVYDGDELHYRLLSAKEISLLHCPILIESKVLKNSVEDLGDFLQGKYSSDEIILKINNRYKNVLDTSFQLSSKSEESIDELVQKLFYQYVGYKLERAELEKPLTMVKLENDMLKQEIRDLTTSLASMKDNARYLNRARYFKNAKIISPTFKEVYKTKGE